MPVPTFDALLEPLFKAMHELGGSASIEEQEERVAELLGLSDDDLAEVHRGNRTKFSYRLAWARTYLKRYGVIANSERGVWSLTPEGQKLSEVKKEAIKKHVQNIDRKERIKKKDDEPEELEEIRKREERKDRLHQNYLKRKASGAQKRYEDKIKKRKKAEIEAKKAAIRAEDIAKGVFVPVSSLPQREPMKGVQTA